MARTPAKKRIPNGMRELAGGEKEMLEIGKAEDADKSGDTAALACAGMTNHAVGVTREARANGKHKIKTES